MARTDYRTAGPGWSTKRSRVKDDELFEQARSRVSELMSRLTVADASLVHSDVKPQNVILGSGRAYLVDLGLVERPKTDTADTTFVGLEQLDREVSERLAAAAKPYLRSAVERLPEIQQAVIIGLFLEERSVAELTQRLNIPVAEIARLRARALVAMGTTFRLEDLANKMDELNDSETLPSQPRSA